MLKLLVLLTVAIVASNASSCRNCLVDGRLYRGNSNFRFDRDCLRYTCQCRCDGSWNCPSQYTQNICRGPSNPTYGSCRSCVVYGRTYGRGPFQMDRGCNRFSCDCNCDGSWKCPAERTKSLCWILDMSNFSNWSQFEIKLIGMKWFLFIVFKVSC